MFFAFILCGCVLPSLVGAVTAAVLTIVIPHLRGDLLRFAPGGVLPPLGSPGSDDQPVKQGDLTVRSLNGLVESGRWSESCIFWACL